MVYAALLNNKGSAILQTRFYVENGMASGYIPLSSVLVSGIYLVTVITGDPAIPAPVKPILVVNPNRPPAAVKNEGMETNHPSNNLNNNINIQPDKMQYGKREKVSIELDAGTTGTSRLSMTIRRADSLENYADSLLSGLHIEPLQVDNTVFSSGEGQFIKATVYPANGTTPAPNVRVFVSVIGTEARIGEAVSDAKGELSYLLPVLFSEAQLVFIPVHNGSTNYRVEYNPDPLDSLPGLQIPAPALPEWLSGPIRTRMVEAQAQNSFRPEEKSMLVISNPDTTDFYGKPDKRYMLDDYTRFPNMEEIITEFVTEVRIRRNGDLPELQVVNAPYKRFFEEPALVLMDGVPVTDIRQLLDLDPLKLQSIDIVSRKFFLGNHNYPGIIHYKSYQGNLGGYTLPVDAAVYSFEGAQLQKAYLTPDYRSASDQHIPDFRNLLLWEPSVVTDSKGKKRLEFFSGDLEGRYKIMLNGVSPSGSPLSGSAFIDIK